MFVSFIFNLKYKIIIKNIIDIKFLIWYYKHNKSSPERLNKITFKFDPERSIRKLYS
nr:MAG TPA_asm: hypothetical protein [Caudoviricetes sp.]